MAQVVARSHRIAAVPAPENTGTAHQERKDYVVLVFFSNKTKLNS